MSRHFDSFIDGFLTYSKDVEAPEKFLRWSAISILAGALERKTWIVFNGTQYIFPNEYIMLVGAPGMAKKSSSSGLAFSLLQEIDRLKFMSTQLTAASLVKQLLDAGRERFVKIESEMYNNSSLYLYSSEAAVTLKEITGSVTELMTDFYDCGPPGWSTTRCWSKETIGGGRTKIFNPCLNMLACSTPDWLVKTIGKDEIKGGFASRILFVVQTEKPERTVGWMDEESVSNNVALKLKLISDLKRISELSGQFKIEKTVRDTFNDIKKRTDKFILENQDDTFIGYFSRKLWHILKLAQILSVNESSDLLLREKHILEALGYVEELEKNMRHAFGAVGTNDKAASLHLLWERIRQTPGTISKQQIHKLCWRDIDGKTLDEHVRMLHEMQKLRVRLVGGHVFYEIVDSTALY